VGTEKLKRHKSPGFDQILSELFKAVVRKICFEIHKLTNLYWGVRRNCQRSGRTRSIPIHVAEQVQQEAVIQCDKKLCQQRVSVVSLPDLTCRIPIDDCKTCLTSPMVLVITAFMYFKEYEEDKQFLTYPSTKLVETLSGSITLSDSKMV
jgi:hypothetical protein